jgi:hypothetical protein
VTATAPTSSVPEVERELALDMLRRGLPAAPVVLLVSGLIWGMSGVASAAYAMGIVGVNLVLSALALAWAARTSLTLLMGVALGGFLVRMGLVTVAILLVRHASWVDLTPLAITVLVAQLGLLFWETRYVSASLAFPGLKPVPGKGL